LNSETECKIRLFISRVTATTAIARLSHCNYVRQSVCPSVRYTGESKTVKARITKSSPSADWKTLVSGSVKLYPKFHKGHPKRGR